MKHQGNTYIGICNTPTLLLPPPPLSAGTTLFLARPCYFIHPPIQPSSSSLSSPSYSPTFNHLSPSRPLHSVVPCTPTLITSLDLMRVQFPPLLLFSTTQGPLLSDIFTLLDYCMEFNIPLYRNLDV